MSRVFTSFRFYAERNLAPVSGAIGPRDLVTVRQLRTIHDAQALLDHQLMASVEPMSHHNDRVILPETSTGDRTLVQEGEEEAGRELDGRTWDEMPAQAPVLAGGEQVARSCFSMSAALSYAASAGVTRRDSTRGRVAAPNPKAADIGKHDRATNSRSAHPPGSARPTSREH